MLIADENLLNIDYQYSDELVKHNCNILMSVHSNYAQQFLALREQVIQNIVEAKSNIEYLQVLLEPTRELQTIPSPTDIPEKLSDILNLIRFIWMESPYFNSDERITQLCRSLSTQIIMKCKEFINLKVVFQDKHTHEAIDMFGKCINCLEGYIKIYSLVISCLMNRRCFCNVFNVHRWPMLIIRTVRRRGTWRRPQFSIKSTLSSSAVGT